MVFKGTEALEVWSKRVCSGYPGVRIVNMTTSFKDGLAFCAIVHRFRPDLINFTSLDPNNALENCKLAFEIGESELGIPSLLDPVDMVNCTSPDRRSVLLYLSQMYQAFGNSSPQTRPRSKSSDSILSHSSHSTAAIESRRKNSTDSGIDTNLSISVDSSLSAFSSSGVSSESDVSPQPRHHPESRPSPRHTSEPSSATPSESDSRSQTSPPKPTRTFLHDKHNLVPSSPEPKPTNSLNKPTNTCSGVDSKQKQIVSPAHANQADWERRPSSRADGDEKISEQGGEGETRDDLTVVSDSMVKDRGESYTTEQVLRRDRTERRSRQVQSMYAGSAFHAALNMFTSLEKKPEVKEAKEVLRRLQSKTTQTEVSLFRQAEEPRSRAEQTDLPTEDSVADPSRLQSKDSSSESAVKVKPEPASEVVRGKIIDCSRPVLPTDTRNPQRMQRNAENLDKQRKCATADHFLSSPNFCTNTNPKFYGRTRSFEQHSFSKMPGHPDHQKFPRSPRVPDPMFSGPVSVKPLESSRLTGSLDIKDVYNKDDNLEIRSVTDFVRGFDTKLYVKPAPPQNNLFWKSRPLSKSNLLLSGKTCSNKYISRPLYREYEQSTLV